MKLNSNIRFMHVVFEHEHEPMQVFLTNSDGYDDSWFQCKHCGCLITV